MRERLKAKASRRQAASPITHEPKRHKSLEHGFGAFRTNMFSTISPFKQFSQDISICIFTTISHRPTFYGGKPEKNAVDFLTLPAVS